MSGYNKGEGHVPNIWCSDKATSRMRYNNQTTQKFTDPTPVDSVRASDSFQNLSHADVIPVSTHANFDALVQLPEGDSAVDLDFGDALLKYINHILLEEDLEEETFMLRESSALQAAEKSFYEVIGEQYPAATDYQYGSNFDKIIENPDKNLFGVNDSTGFYDSGTLLPDLNSDSDCSSGMYIYHDTSERNSQSTSQSSYASSNSQSTSQSSNASSSRSGTQGAIDSPVNTLIIPDIFGDSQSIMQFKKGVEEASKFLSKGTNLVAGLRYDALLPKEGSANLSVKVDSKIGNDEVVDALSGKRNPHYENMGLEEERSNKQSAVFVESTVSSDMFDRVLLYADTDLREAFNEIAINEKHSGQSKGPSGRKSGGRKKQGKRNVVDMSTLLTLCARAVAAEDRRTTNELLKQIRQHATPSGDGMQRLAHYVADGLEARMAGSGSQIYETLLRRPIHASKVLKSYLTYLGTCPFRNITNFFANKTILNVSEKALKLHIIDFGVLYGFQWPSFLQKLSMRPGGPPKLRFTGVDFPIPGFRPSIRVEETGRRLASHAKTFGVPFEFHAIAQKWETIKLEDLKIQKDEMVAVSSHFKLRDLLDETVVVNSPRDTILLFPEEFKRECCLRNIYLGGR
ncbi:scarecrow-like protein 14 isoform X2 [Salvia splendens]|uniref:scarecrow-like protein 14 isoform X2 n=1 Tax=Salvia splendens TaxID=180675 RepID=UPI001C26E677|nr:scarecrow-like protein 14 isoform X2 [Salvia splendens]